MKKSKYNTSKLQKTLKVCNSPQGNGYVPGIRLCGKYLSEFGFELGDTVCVEISKNKIIIKSHKNGSNK